MVPIAFLNISFSSLSIECMISSQPLLRAFFEMTRVASDSIRYKHKEEFLSENCNCRLDKARRKSASL